MIRNIRQTLLQTEKELTIVWTIDICKSFQYLNALEMVSKSPQNRIRCLAALDLEEFERNPAFYMKQLYLLLSKNKTVFFEFYNGKNLKQISRNLGYTCNWLQKVIKKNEIKKND